MLGNQFHHYQNDKMADSGQKPKHPSGRRVFMHDVIMGLDTLEDESLN